MTPKKDWKPAFLEAYAESGNVKASAQAAGITKQNVYAARKKSKTFAEQFKRAREEAADNLEGVAFKRAEESSDTLLIFLLKGLKPETYGDKVRHGGIPGAPVEVVVKWGND